MTNLLLEDYQRKARKTAEPRAYHHEYLVNGIVGEIGELFGACAKAHWHEKPASELQTELILEYGDIAWMTALLLHTLDVHEVDELPDGPPNWMGSLDPWQHLLARGLDLHGFYVEFDEGHTNFLKSVTVKLWAVLNYRCQEITGVPFDYVLDMNLAKLADRAARGVLKGNGDHR